MRRREGLTVMPHVMPRKLGPLQTLFHSLLLRQLLLPLLLIVMILSELNPSTSTRKLDRRSNKEAWTLTSWPPLKGIGAASFSQVVESAIKTVVLMLAVCCREGLLVEMGRTVRAGYLRGEPAILVSSASREASLSPVPKRRPP